MELGGVEPPSPPISIHIESCESKPISPKRRLASFDKPPQSSPLAACTNWHTVPPPNSPKLASYLANKGKLPRLLGHLLVIVTPAVDQRGPDNYCADYCHQLEGQTKAVQNEDS